MAQILLFICGHYGCAAHKAKGYIMQMIQLSNNKYVADDSPPLNYDVNERSSPRHVTRPNETEELHNEPGLENDKIYSGAISQSKHFKPLILGHMSLRNT